MTGRNEPGAPPETVGALRVLMVDSEQTWRGGEAQLRLLMAGLLDEGVSVKLAAPLRSEIFKRTRALDVPFFSLSIGGGMDMVSAWRLRSLLRRERFDVIHSHSSHAHSVSFLACAALRRKPFQVVSRRVDFPVAQNRFSAVKYHRGADMYLAISNGVRDVLVECGIPAGRIRLVPSGIDLNKFKTVRDSSYVKSEFGITDETPVVGNVAALAPHKAQSDLLEAARTVVSRVPKAKFMIVGEGKLRDKLESQIRKLKLEKNVVLTGFREDPLEIMSTFWCFVSSSRLEGLGTSIMDAQAMGIPVVATRTGGVPDIVENGVTGLLVPPGDPEALAAGVLSLLESRDLRQRIAIKSVKRSEGYDHRRMVYKTLDAYRYLVGSKNRRGQQTKRSQA